MVQEVAALLTIASVVGLIALLLFQIYLALGMGVVEAIHGDAGGEAVRRILDAHTIPAGA